MIEVYKILTNKLDTRVNFIIYFHYHLFVQ